MTRAEATKSGGSQVELEKPKMISEGRIMGGHRFILQSISVERVMVALTTMGFTKFTDHKLIYLGVHIIVRKSIVGETVVSIVAPHDLTSSYRAQLPMIVNNTRIVLTNLCN